MPDPGIDVIGKKHILQFYIGSFRIIPYIYYKYQYHRQAPQCSGMISESCAKSTGTYASHITLLCKQQGKGPCFYLKYKHELGIASSNRQIAPFGLLGPNARRSSFHQTAQSCFNSAISHPSVSGLSEELYCFSLGLDAIS